MYQSSSDASICTTVINTDSCTAQHPQQTPLELMKAAAAAAAAADKTDDAGAAALTEAALLLHQQRHRQRSRPAQPGTAGPAEAAGGGGRESALPWHCAEEYSESRAKRAAERELSV